MFINGWNFVTQVYYIPTFYQLVYRYSSTKSGALLLPITLTQTLSSTLSGLLVTWTGRYREAILFGWALWAVGLGMILGGAMGNLVDRFFRSPGPLRGHVVDFLSIGWWPVFNVADPSVVGGAILLVTLSAMGYDFDTVGRRRPDDDDDDAERSDAEEWRRQPRSGYSDE